MILKRCILIGLFIIWVGQDLMGQMIKIGLVMYNQRNRVTIPFTKVNNLVIVPVTINNRITLKYILDTGANNPILTEKVFGDIMGLNYDRSILISGPGINDSIGAHVATDITLGFPGGIKGQHMSMLVLEEDYIELKKNLGEDIYGIIGYSVFSRFVVSLNYDKEEMTLYDPESFTAPKRYKAFKLSLENTKPYITAVVNQNNKVDTMKLMLDTGASHALLLDIDESKIITRPDSTLDTSLGHGLGGEIPGKIGRLQELQVGDNELKNILVSIPDQGVYSNSIKRGSRHGTIGGSTLSRFNPIIDYNNGFIYLHKGRTYRDPFKYDMSGMRLSYFESPERLQITGLTENGPAELAGLKVGDIIKHVNGQTIFDGSLSDIYGLLKSRPNRKIRVSVLRDGVKKEFVFRLRKMI